ncbi:MAG TPA: GNAT family N-acetyltransferase [Bacillota bacterium]|nr:GNAT family N-acetyltransferase [Bacillota bacterium]
MNIRTIERNDAEKLMKVMQQVESESKFMLLENGERNTNIPKAKQWIDDVLKQTNSTIFIAEENNHFIGYVMAFGGKARRNRHAAYIVMGMIHSHRSKGIGTQLLQKLEQWAIEQDIHRLELTVMKPNKVALGLYKKVGFEIEGTKKHSLLVEGQFIDEYTMSKLL